MRHFRHAVIAGIARNLRSGVVGSGVVLAALALPCAAQAPAVTQPTQPAPAQPPAAAPPTDPADVFASIDLSKLPAWVKVGVTSIRQRLGVKSVPCVVIVADGRSYLDAIAKWTPTAQYPVLIDDGSLESREDIARFVRAYAPEHVFRWAAPGSKGGGPDAFRGFQPGDLGDAMVGAWSAPAAGEPPRTPDTPLHLRARYQAWKHEPQGVVVTSKDDPAWPAAVALAAGRGELMLLRDVPQRVDGSWSFAEANEFCGWLDKQMEATGLIWGDIGEGIDAITLCNNGPCKIDAGQGSLLATTDRVGRIADSKDRWAFCSQIFGGPSRAAYQAMCGLFARPRGAWIFDAYADDAAFKPFDGTETGKAFDSAGIPVEVYDAPKQGLRDWRLRAARAIDADLIFVNSSGEPDRFGLRPGDGRPGDIPVLRLPSVVAFVHSFSAQFPANRDLIAGRWMERGAFAYVGSVHEPFLQAFVPTPILARRLRAAGPWGAVVRVDNAPLWKITCFGDPLWVAGPPSPIAAGARPPLEGLADAAADLPADLKGGRVAPGLEALVLCGRDAEAAKLAQAVLSEEPASMTPAAAAAAIMPLFRAGMGKELVAAYAKLDAPRRANPMLRDALWLAAYPLLDAPDKAFAPVLFSTLAANIRPMRPGRDAGDLAAAVGRVQGAAAAEKILADAKAALTGQGQRDEFDRDAKR